MPIGPAGVAAISTAGNFVTDALNIRAQKKENTRSRDFSRGMANLENQWGIDAFNRTNEYNHPSQQMQRLREAGLNPHLIYGKGAQNTAQMQRSGSGKSATTQAPQSRTSSLAIMQAAQVANIMAQTQASKAQSDLLMAQKLKVGHEAEILSIDAQIKAFTAQDIMDSAGYENRVKLSHEASNLQNVSESKRRMKLIAEQIIHEASKAELSKLHEYMRGERGLEPSDAKWSRVLSTILKNWAENPGSLPQSLQWLMKYF